MVSTRETVNELLRRIAAGDPGRIAELYAEEVSWKLSWPAGDHMGVVPWIQQRSTRAGVEEHFRLIADHHVAKQSSAEVFSVLVDALTPSCSASSATPPVRPGAAMRLPLRCT